MTESSSEYPHKVRWSNSADPGAVPSAWTPASTNDAGSNVIGETEGFIVDGLQLRDEFIIYKEDSAYGMQWIGGEFVFRFRFYSDVSVGTPRRQREGAPVHRQAEEGEEAR